MKNKQKFKTPVLTRIVVYSMFILLTIGLMYFVSVSFNGKNKLPVLGEPGHRAATFTFINQDGDTLTEKAVHNKVTVVEYFFTSCPSICPTMNRNLKEVYNQFKTNSGFMILSHTVDPERDSASVLKAYAKRLDVLTPEWQFLTGNKDSLYQMAGRDYLLSAEDSLNSNFIHTQYVALLDKKRQVRGFYDMTRKENISKLDSDIEQLLKEDANE
jgi:protein SCO1/2